MDDIIRLVKGTLELIKFLITVLIVFICVIPYFTVFILPVYIWERLTNNFKRQ